MMNLKILGGFLLGMGVGGLGAWYITKTNIEKKKNQEVDQLLEKYRKKIAETQPERTTKEEATREERLAYIRKTSLYRADTNEPDVPIAKPETTADNMSDNYTFGTISSNESVICNLQAEADAPTYIVKDIELVDDIMVNEEYPVVEMTYYADDILVYDDEEKEMSEKEIAPILGSEWLNKFDEGCDVVYVKNHILELAYAIRKSDYAWAEYKDNPRMVK